MAAPTQIIGDVTYTATTASNAITLSDADWSNIHAIAKLTDAINRLVQQMGAK